MSYSYQKNANGEQDLVISGWENGIADSPYSGIANIRNLNIRYYAGVAYVNYKRQACTLSGGSLGQPIHYTQSPAGIIYIADNLGNIFKQNSVNSGSFTILGKGSRGSSLAGSAGIQFWNNYLFAFRSNRVEICGDGTGDSGITSSNWNPGSSTTGVWPILTGVSVTLSGTPNAGDVSATISSYTDAQGNAGLNYWNGPSGQYLASIPTTGNSVNYNQDVLVTLIQGDSDISWTPGLNRNGRSANITLNPMNAVNCQSIVSINDGLLYFCNGSTISSFQINDPYTPFNATDMTTFAFNSSALALPLTDNAVYISELVNKLIIGANPYSGQTNIGGGRLYPWDRVSPQWDNPIPIQEQFVSMINILNVLYIFAGNKGNIYTSGGTSVSPFKKMPDYVSGTIDPAWLYGGIMSHRQKLYFQALAIDSQTGNPVIAGIFSIGLVNPAIPTGLETPSALVMENQNSIGLVSNSTQQFGVLIDNNSTLLNYDNYYSAYTDTTNGIDYNTTTLYSSNEPTIETDLIPIGTKYQQKTFGSVEFKLDQALQSGDSITIYARQSLSDSYVQLGTTSSTVLSDFYTPLGFQEWQWIQFMITMSCNPTATSSSFIRIREIHIR